LTGQQFNYAIKHIISFIAMNAKDVSLNFPVFLAEVFGTAYNKI